MRKLRVYRDIPSYTPLIPRAESDTSVALIHNGAASLAGHCSSIVWVSTPIPTVLTGNELTVRHPFERTASSTAKRSKNVDRPHEISA